MEKDKIILDLVEKLKSLENFSQLQFADYWDADLCSFGLKKESRLMYISGYNYAEDETPKYDYDLELDYEKNPG